MMTRELFLTVLAFATATGTVMADEAIFLTPPLYREQARTTAAVRPASELTTTPSLTPAARKNARIAAEVAEMPAR